jgi:hypothetical protein
MEWVGLIATAVLGVMWLLMWLFYAHDLDVIGRLVDWLDRHLAA